MIRLSPRIFDRGTRSKTEESSLEAKSRQYLYDFGYYNFCNAESYLKYPGFFIKVFAGGFAGPYAAVESTVHNKDERMFSTERI